MGKNIENVNTNTVSIDKDEWIGLQKEILQSKLQEFNKEMREVWKDEVGAIPPVDGRFIDLNKLVTSPEISNIAEAMAKFHQNLGTIGQSGVGYYDNKYATLDEILAKVNPELGKQGLTVIQVPEIKAEEIRIATMLIHESGEFISFPQMSLFADNLGVHSLGSALTYARRYSLNAILAIATSGEDDDGTMAQQEYETNQKQGVKKKTNVKDEEERAKLFKELEDTIKNGDHSEEFIAGFFELVANENVADMKEATTEQLRKFVKYFKE